MKPRKKRNETDREYIIRIHKNKCGYCLKEFPSKHLSVVRKHPQQDLPKIFDGIPACRECAEDKGGLSHGEYLKVLRQRKKEVRQEEQENKHELGAVTFEKYGYQCIYCIAEYGQHQEGRKLTIDHKTPVSRGGSNLTENICCACEEHNREKGSLTAKEFLEVIKKRKKNA